MTAYRHEVAGPSGERHLLDGLEGPPNGLVRRRGMLTGLRVLEVGPKDQGSRSPSKRDRLFIGLGDPSRAEAMGFKRDANLPVQGRLAFSTGHDCLLVPMVWGYH